MQNTVKSIQYSDEQALADSNFRPQMINPRSITGMEFPTGLYTYVRDQVYDHQGSASMRAPGAIEWSVHGKACFDTSSSFPDGPSNGVVRQLDRNMKLTVDPKALTTLSMGLLTKVANNKRVVKLPQKKAALTKSRSHQKP